MKRRMKIFDNNNIICLNFSMSVLQQFPEVVEDSAFLNNIPADMSQREAELAFCKFVEDQRLLHRDTMNAEWTAGLKMVLGLEGYAGNADVSMVLCNAILDAERVCGYRAPDLIIANIFNRRRRYQETIQATAS